MDIRMDFIILFIFIFITSLSIYRGFTKEILSLLTFIGAICLSIISNKFVCKKIMMLVDEPLIASSVGYIASFLFFLLILAIINLVIIKIFKINHVSIIDRILGTVLGLIKSYIICLVIYFGIFTINSITYKEPSNQVKEDRLESENNKNNNDNDLIELEKFTPDYLKNSLSYPLFYFSIKKMDGLMRFAVDNFKKHYKKDEVLDKLDRLDEGATKEVQGSTKDINITDSKNIMSELNESIDIKPQDQVSTNDLNKAIEESKEEKLDSKIFTEEINKALEEQRE